MSDKADRISPNAMRAYLFWLGTGENGRTALSRGVADAFAIEDAVNAELKKRNPTSKPLED